MTGTPVSGNAAMPPVVRLATLTVELFSEREDELSEEDARLLNLSRFVLSHSGCSEESSESGRSRAMKGHEQG